MALEKFAGFTFSHAAQEDTPDLTPEQVKTAFDSRGEELKTFLDSLIDILNSVTDGGSGADNVAATAIEGLTGNTVQALLESLKTALDEAILGAIPDGSLATAKYADKSVTAAKVADDVATQAELDALTEHFTTFKTDVGSNVKLLKLNFLDLLIARELESLSTEMDAGYWWDNLQDANKIQSIIGATVSGGKIITTATSSEVVWRVHEIGFLTDKITYYMNRTKTTDIAPVDAGVTAGNSLITIKAVTITIS